MNVIRMPKGVTHKDIKMQAQIEKQMIMQRREEAEAVAAVA
jgi:hypothetical protein